MWSRAGWPPVRSPGWAWPTSGRPPSCGRRTPESLWATPSCGSAGGRRSSAPSSGAGDTPTPSGPRQGYCPMPTFPAPSTGGCWSRSLGPGGGRNGENSSVARWTVGCCGTSPGGRSTPRITPTAAGPCSLTSTKSSGTRTCAGCWRSPWAGCPGQWRTAETWG